jgi:hypothetical protein
MRPAEADGDHARSAHGVHASVDALLAREGGALACLLKGAGHQAETDEKGNEPQQPDGENGPGPEDSPGDKERNAIELEQAAL